MFLGLPRFISRSLRTFRCSICGSIPDDLELGRRRTSSHPYANHNLGARSYHDLGSSYHYPHHYMATCHNEHSFKFYSFHLVDLFFLFLFISQPFGFYFVLGNRKRRRVDRSGWWSIPCWRRQFWRQ